MMLDPELLIDGYLDETLSAEEHAALVRWLKEDAGNAQRFARAVFLHDRLRGELLARAATTPETRPTVRVSARGKAYRRLRPAAAVAAVAITAAVLVAMLWKGLGETPVSASVVELNRLIAANANPTDRTYRINAEDLALLEPRDERLEPPDGGRPPKPPIDGAVLHVRGGDQFVLVRTTRDGLPFVTGCNGKTSWAVRPDGPVRVSSDLARFNRDVPGHEHAVPFTNMKEALERLRTAYDVTLLPFESLESERRADEEPTRLLVAVKKPGYRGPRRVEITYAAQSGQIRQLRFVEMPYGPDRVTLRLTLVEERNLGASFFDHTSHHGPDRAVELE